MILFADTREPKYIIELLSRWGVQTRIRKLDVGDYIIGDIGIERKNIHDFYRSIIDKRVFDQLKRLKDAYNNAILILEGDIQTEMKNIFNPNAVLGGLISISIDLDIKVLYSREIYETARILYMLWRRMVNRRGETILRYKPKILSKRDRLIFIIEGFPGVGSKLAENILNHFRTIRKFANTTISELTEIEGVGNKKAREIYEILNMNFRKISRDK